MAAPGRFGMDDHRLSQGFGAQRFAARDQLQPTDRSRSTNRERCAGEVGRRNRVQGRPGDRDRDNRHGPAVSRRSVGRHHRGPRRGRGSNRGTPCRPGRHERTPWWQDRIEQLGPAAASPRRRLCGSVRVVGHRDPARKTCTPVAPAGSSPPRRHSDLGQSRRDDELRGANGQLETSTRRDGFGGGFDGRGRGLRG